MCQNELLKSQDGMTAPEHAWADDNKMDQH